MRDIEKYLRLYLVTDPSFENRAPLEKLVEQALLGGVSLVQLREKNLPFPQFLQKAQRVKAVCDKYHVPLIINDNIAVALQCGADGLHIGQGDMPVAAAREQLGKEKILGVSASSVMEAKAAQAAGADYLGIGAVFATDTKADANVVTPATIRAITDAIAIPTCAIGGLKQHNLEILRGTGVEGVAVVSAILGAIDITKASRELRCAAEGVLFRQSVRN